MSATNGTTAEETSALAKLHQDWIQAGSKKPSKEALQGIKKELLVAERAYEEAAKALEKAQELKQTAAIKAVRALGSKVRIDLGDGRVVAPSCRGTAVFYRRVGETDTV